MFQHYGYKREIREGCEGVEETVGENETGNSESIYRHVPTPPDLVE
jgi:hypothetical protein